MILNNHLTDNAMSNYGGITSLGHIELHDPDRAAIPATREFLFFDQQHARQPSYVGSQTSVGDVH